MQALDDLIVQTEIFLQYSLHAKAVERLQKIGVDVSRKRRTTRAAEFVSDGDTVAQAAAKPQPVKNPASGERRWSKEEADASDRTHGQLHRRDAARPDENFGD